MNPPVRKFMPGPSPSKSTGDYIRQVGAYSILLASFSLGVGLCSVFWSSTVSSLNQQITQARTDLTKSTDELSQVKADYFAYRILHDKPVTTISTPSVPTDTTYGNPVDSKAPRIEIKQIDTGKSAQFFDDELTISLIASDYGGNPLRYLVTANISSAHGKVVTALAKDVGFVTTYAASKKYRITILSAGTFAATFRVVEQE